MPDWRMWWELNKDTFLVDDSWRAPEFPRAPGAYQVAGEEPTPWAPPEAAVAFLRAQAEDSDTRVARSALVALGKLGLPADMDLLSRAVRQGPIPLRQGAAFALGLHGSPEALAKLRESAGDASTPAQVREAAVLALGCGNPKDGDSVELLAGLLPDRSATPSLRTCAAMSLGALGARGDLLGETLQDRGAPVSCRTACALALGLQAMDSDRRRETPDLVALYRQQSDPQFRRSLALAAGPLLDPQQSDAFASILRSELDTLTKAYGMISLAASGSRGAMDTLCRNLEDPSQTPMQTGLRPFCSLGLAAAGRAENFESIRTALNRSRDATERTGHALALSLLRKADAPTLDPLLAERAYPVLQGIISIGAVVSLAEPGAQKVRGTIDTQGRSPEMLRSGVLGLGSQRDGQDLDRFYAGLSDPDRYARGAAVLALGWSGRAEVVDGLLSRAGASGASATLREGACAALGALLSPERTRRIRRFSRLVEPTHLLPAALALLETI
ncbi:MAG: HEAT repeat domain-containing protein [Planctomycetes bacterium]|nr:HEAT repeat domain-containing protein [Planctomycetota bacterium]